MSMPNVADNGDPISAAIDAAEEVRDPLDDLVETTTADPGAAFMPEVLERLAARDGTLADFLKPDLSPGERAVAQIEGWILGVPGVIRAAGQRENSATSAACDSRVFRLR